jgi:hypothetical protein
MGISHRNVQTGVAENLLQRDQIAAIHDKMTGKGMPENMAICPLGKIMPVRFIAERKAA